MSAALGDMTTAKNGVTQQFNLKNTSKKFRTAYPLTIVIYAMVPTGGISKRKAAKIAQWLDYVAGPGQQPGFGPGELPPGYLPLTATMRAQTLKAAREVLNQAGKKAKHAASTTPTASASPSSSASATKSSSPRTISLGYDSHPGTSGPARYALQVLLIAGVLLALAGSTGLVVGRRGGAAALSRLRRARVLTQRLPGLRLPRRTRP
jgi:hypothetical protein